MSLGEGTQGLKRSLGERRERVQEWVQNNTTDIAETICLLGDNARDWVQQSRAVLNARLQAGLASLKQARGSLRGMTPVDSC